MKNFKHLPLGLVTICSLFSIANAQAITGCPDPCVMGPINVYSDKTLSSNVYVSSGNGIVVYRDNVTVDGNGFGVYGGSYASSGVEIRGMKNVTIEDLDVEDFDRGIYITYAENITIDHVDVYNSDIYGIQVFSSPNTILTSNYVYGSGSHGVWIFDSNNSSVEYTSSRYSEGDGFRVDSSSDINFYNAKAFYNDKNGFSLNSCHDTSGSRMQAGYNGVDGILLNYSNSSQLYQTLSAGNDNYRLKLLYSANNIIDINSHTTEVIEDAYSSSHNNSIY